MRDKTIKAVKENNKAFVKGDIILYAVIAALIVILLCVFLIPQKQSENLEEIEIFYRENMVFSYDFSTKSVTIINGYENIVDVKNDDGGLLVILNTEEGRNVLFIGDDFAKMTEADCSGYADCVKNFSAIENGGDIIVCLPHHIKVVGVGGISNEVKL